MDFGPREVLIVLGALLVCGIVLDGVRRMRAARRGSLRGPRRQSIFDDADSGAGYDNDELAGPARVVAIRNDEATAEVNLNLRKGSDMARTRPYRELVPGEARDDPEFDAATVEIPETPTLVAPHVDPDLSDATAVADEESTEHNVATPAAQLPLDMDDLPLFRGEPALERFGEDTRPARPPRRGKRRGRAAPESAEVASEAEELDAVVVHVMAPPGQTFSARPLFAALQHEGLQFGDRNIFHRYGEAAGGGGEPVTRFSVANALKPGAFEGSVGDFQTPGVAFFMLVNDLPEPLAVFDDMLKAAQATALELNAELKDERRAPLTRTGIAQYRQRILDHSRRHDLPG